MVSTGSEGRVRVWPTQGTDPHYPEQSYGTPPRTGVCFSGGSTRSYAATLGQLRGLVALGLLSRIGYLSAVSGAAWATTAFRYYARRDVPTSVMLGEVLPPEALIPAQLGTLVPEAIAHAATRSFGRRLKAAQQNSAVPPTRVWSHTVGQTFLAPFGLYEPDTPVGFTATRHVRSEIVARNPTLRPAGLVTVADDRLWPLWLVHATVNWPPDDNQRPEAVPIEFSSLASGSPQRLTLRGPGGARHVVGGGLVESFALGCAAPQGSPDHEGAVNVALPETPFTLADAIGASSAFSTPERDLSRYPHVRCWPMAGASPTTTDEVLTDGGDLDNYGLLPLLRRRVRSVLVCINTMWPLASGYDPGVWPDEDRANARPIDPSLAPLFGAPSERFPHNQVFEEAAFAPLVRELQRAKAAGRPLLAVTTLRVKSNKRWGIAGDWDVRVGWLYNDRVPAWEARLPPETQHLIDVGRRTEGAGLAARFPHYLTREHNPGDLIRLTPTQVNLLAHLSCWNICATERHVRRLLGS